MSNGKILGRTSAGPGEIEEINVGSGLSLSGGTLSATGGGGGGGGVDTDLSIANRNATTLDIASSSGLDVTVPAATTSLTGLMTAASLTKLNGIATGATANASDADLRDRSTHTGTQPWGTITSTPVTLVGYGITDAASNGAVGSSGLTMSTARILGRTTASTGAIEQISIGSGLSLSGGTLSATGTAFDFSASNTYTGANTFRNTAGQSFAPNLIQDGITIRGGPNGSNARRVILVNETLTTDQTFTFRDVTGTPAMQESVNTFSQVQTFQANNTFTGSNTFRSLSGQTFAQNTIRDAIHILGGNNGSLARKVSLGVDTLSEDRSINFPNASGTIVLAGAATGSGLTMSTARLLGRSTASTGAIEEITVGSGLSFSGGTLSATGGGGGSDQPLYIDAAEFIPRTTNGCGVDSQETSTNRVNRDLLAFDPAAIEYAQKGFAWPVGWNTATATFFWKASSGTGSCVWLARMRIFTDGDAEDQAFGTAQSVTDAAASANTHRQTAATSAITPGGTVANSSQCILEVYRDPTNGSDDLAVDALLIGVLLTKAS